MSPDHLLSGGIWARESSVEVEEMGNLRQHYSSGHMQCEYTNGGTPGFSQAPNTCIHHYLDIGHKTHLAALGSPSSCFQSALDLHGHMVKHSQ